MKSRADVVGQVGDLDGPVERSQQDQLAQVADVPDEHLGAYFVCAAALARPDGTEVVVEGRWPGRLVRVPRGSNGFGYDPIFVPEGEQRTSAELSDEAKDAASHRGRALRALLPSIGELAARSQSADDR